jgi:hypothetical protein
MPTEMDTPVLGAVLVERAPQPPFADDGRSLF